MTIQLYSCLSHKDSLNFLKKRNVRNTDKNMYNCGGYALNTYSWYDFYDFEKYERKLERYNFTDCLDACKAEILHDFGNQIRVLESIDSPIAEDEYMLAFRVSSDGDFHFVKRDKNNHWWHKRGASHYIKSMSKEELLSNYWCDIYDSPTIFFAKKI